MKTLVLKPGREKSLLRRHPWVFSGAVARVEADLVVGETVELLTSEGEFVGRAAYSPSSNIRARVWTFDPDETVDAEFFRRRIRSAINLRQTFTASDSVIAGDAGEADSKSARQSIHDSTDALRLVHAESDGLPGLVVDRYAHVLVTQFLTAGAESWRETIADLLLEETGLKDICDRSDADVRTLEGLEMRSCPLRGTPPSSVAFMENRLSFTADFAGGHKTGFYLDQRVNRLRVRQLAENRCVLDCFCYTGGFSVNALAGGASSVLAVDSSAEALKRCLEHATLNGLPAEHLETSEGDVFKVLRKMRDEERSFDLIVLDPPKFAPTSAQVERAARGYKDINRLAFKLLRPGGILATFSCSGGVDAGLFQKIVASAALDAGVEAVIVEHLAQAPDHPVSVHFPEGAYLKGLVCVRTGSLA